TTPSGSTDVTATPSEPTSQSRPIVGVAKRVRVIDGIPTMNASIVPPIPAIRLSQFGRSDDPLTGSKIQKLPMIVNTIPTPVQKRGMPTGTSTATATIAATSSPTAHHRDGTSAMPKHARIVQPAPPTPAPPPPAVKNSKISSASPTRNSRYATGGLATVWNS